MLILDDLTIIICAVLFLLAIASVLTDTFLKAVPGLNDNAEADNLEPVSVVVIADNNSCELDKHLPSFLSQNYPAGYEVIVVVSKNEDNTDDVLKSYEACHDYLYSTFVPDTSRYMSRRKLAITLGVKAAKNGLILLTDADCCPDTDKWILSMASIYRNSNASMVIGYSNYASETKPFYQFCRLHHQYLLMCQANSGRPYATASRNLMFEKKMFMEAKGFQGNLKYLRGEYEFLVNKYGEDHVVAVATIPECRMTEDEPTRMAYTNESLFYAETRKHLLHGFRHRMAFNADMAFLHLGLWASVAAGIYSVLTLRWLILCAAVLALAIPFTTRTLSARRAARHFNTNVLPVYAVLYELRFIWHNLAVRLRHWRADETDFTSHKS